MDKDAIKGILQRYIPPLSPSMIEEISEAIFNEVEKESQSQQVAASSSGRTRRKRK
jgi:hypothetical protein